MTRKADPDHPILPQAWKHEVVSFHCEGEGEERYAELGLRHRETDVVVRLRFLGVKDVYFSDGPESHGLEIRDIASRQLEGASVEVCNFENAPDRVRLLSRSVVKLETTQDGRTATSFPPAVVLDPAVNQAIVKMPDRKFPGVLVQGDSLHSLRGDVADAANSLRMGDVDGASSNLGIVLQRLDELLGHYEAVLKRAGVDLPY